MTNLFLKDRLKVESRYSTCKEPEPITIKVKSARPTENGIEYEFASQGEADLFWASYNEVPIRMIFIPPE